MTKKNIQTKASPSTVTLKLSEMGRFFEGLNIGGGKPSKPYSQVEWVWLCVNKIIEVCSDIQMLLTTADDKIVESGPVYDFLFNRKEMSFQRLLSETVGYYSIFREVYWIFAEKNGTAPANIIVAGPNHCKPEVVNGVVVGYNYFPPGSGKMIPLFLEDVWPIMNFNPDIKYHGVGPVESGELSISANHQATQFNEAILRNGAKPGTILITPAGVKLDEDDKRFLISQFETTHGGARKAGKTFLATGGMQVENFGQTMAELQMIELRKYDASTICAMFGVPTELVSLNSEAQYAHGPATQRFILYTISPMLSLIAQNITLGILYNFRFKDFSAVELKQAKFYCGQRIELRRKDSYRKTKLKAIGANQNLFAYFDVESHPAIQEMQRDKAEKVLKYIERGIPLNEVIDAYDLPFDTSKMPWGNEHWISPTLVPARWIMDLGPESLTEPALPEGQPAGEPEPKKNIDLESVESAKSASENIEEKDDARKHRIWSLWTKSWSGIEKEYSEALRKFFLRQQREILDKLNSALQSVKSAESAINKDSSDEIIARIVFDLKKEGNKIRAINQTFFDKASELGIRQIAIEAGMTSAVLNQFVETAKRSTAIRRALVLQSQNITSINRTTQNMLARTLRDGLESGEGLNDLTARVKKVLGSNRNRALSIARTQTSGAVSSGRHTGMSEAGIEGKIWLDAHDNNVRDLHKDAGRRYAKAIPINEPFVVGGDFLMHPGDPHGSAANIIHCRCLELAGKVGETKTNIFARYTQIKFYTYEDMQIKAA